MIEKIISVWSETSGQDLIEYALMGGFVAAAAGAIVPEIATILVNILGMSGPHARTYTRIIFMLVAVAMLGAVLLRRKGEQE